MAASSEIGAASTDTPRHCSLCGDSTSLETARLECVTETTWKRGKKDSFKEYTAPCLWEVALCRNCRLVNYRGSLKARMRGALVLFFIGLLGILLGGWAVVSIQATGKIGKGDPALLLVGGLSLLLALASIGIYLISKIRWLAAGKLEEIPLKGRSQTFINAGETILERLDTGQGGPVYGSFALPALPETPQRQEGVDLENLKKESQKRLVREMY